MSPPDTTSDSEATDSSTPDPDDCDCTDLKKLASVTSRTTGVTLHTAYECRDCGREFVK